MTAAADNLAPPAARGDWPVLVALFRDASPQSQSHWNPLTGEVFSLPRRGDRQRRADAFGLRLMREEGWQEVPWLESDDAFALLTAFVQGLAAGRGKRELLYALDADKPFRSVRAVLGRSPGLARRYQRVVAAEAELRLVQFCLDLGLELGAAEFASLAAELAVPELQAAAPTERRSLAALSIGRFAGLDDGDGGDDA
jgi:hypothetical protein